MPDNIFLHMAVALAFLCAALLIALPAWWARQWTAKQRALLLTFQCGVLMSLPWGYKGPLALKAIVVLATCAVLTTKLLDTLMHPQHWADRPFREWLLHLPNSLILVPRLHVNAPGAAGGARRLIHGLLEASLGGALLTWSFGRAEWDAAFWTEHMVKLAGAYWLIFDGGFVLGEGLIRVLGGRVLPLSLAPVWSATPAEFWRRYNCEAGRFLRENVFYPLGGRRRPALMAVVTFCINGILHEYLALLMIGRITGYQLLFFALQGSAVALTLRVRPSGAARTAGIAGTILFLYLSSVLFFATIDRIVPWYSSL